MILPYVAFMFFCGIIPIAYGILEVRNPSWVNMEGGYETFIKVLQDFRMAPALINVLFLLLIFVPLMVVTVLVVSLLWIPSTSNITTSCDCFFSSQD